MDFVLISCYSFADLLFYIEVKPRPKGNSPVRYFPLSEGVPRSDEGVPVLGEKNVPKGQKGAGLPEEKVATIRLTERFLRFKETFSRDSFAELLLSLPKVTKSAFFSGTNPNTITE